MNLIFLIFILLQISKIITNNYFSFPFYTNITNQNITKENIIDILSDNKIYIELSIGTPIQKIPVYLKLTQFVTFISSNLCNNSIIKFNQNKTTSINYLSDLKNHSFIHCKEGYLISETINLNKKTIDNFKIILATKISSNDGHSGELGLSLGFSNFNIFVNATFIQQLKQKNMIDNYSFNLKYKNEKEGEFIIGKYPHEYNKNYDEIFFKTEKIGAGESLNPYYWEITFDKINSGNNDVSYQKICNLYYEFGFITGTETYYKSILKEFFQNLIENKICYGREYKQYNTFVCNKDFNAKDFPELTFYSKQLNYNFTFNSKDLFFEFEKEFYFQIIFSKNLNVRWGLGKPFFKKYQIIFDRDRKIYGIYTNVKKGFEFNISILIIIILFIGLMIALLFIKKLIKGKRKIRANELEDNYEYMPSINGN